MNSGILCTRTMIFLIYNVRGSLLSCLFCLTAPPSASLPFPSQAATMTLEKHLSRPTPAHWVSCPGLWNQEAPRPLCFQAGALLMGQRFVSYLLCSAWASCSVPLLWSRVQHLPFVSAPLPHTPLPGQQPQAEDPATVSFCGGLKGQETVSSRKIHKLHIIL